MDDADRRDEGPPDPDGNGATDPTAGDSTDPDDELAALTRELVAIPSHDGEAAAGDALEAWLREHTDAEVVRDERGLADDEVAARGGNLIARKDGSEATPDAGTLALVGHHDVVPPGDPQVEADGAYVVEERDGRLYGRGTADMKGAVAAMALAFRDADPAGELVFTSFVGEEVGGVGARAAIDAGFAPDWAVVAEGSTGYSAPGVTDVAVAHKGRRAVTVEAEGESTHASTPDEGVNAIYRACGAVEALAGVEAPAVEVAGEALAGSLAVTEIAGGSAWNTIPGSCSVTVDERTVPGERVDLAGVLGGLEGVDWTVDQDLPPMRCSDDGFADVVLDTARAVQSTPEEPASAGQPQLVTKPHATDAGWLADRAGTACVVCGPAEPGEAHTDTESVSLSTLARCREIYRRVAEAWP